MGGENNNFVGRMEQAFHGTLNVGQYQRAKNAWVHEPFSKEIMACSVQTAFEAINPPPSDKITDDLILGFKTIRLHQNENVTQTAQFLRESFPCARYLVNYKSPEALKDSFDKVGFKKKGVTTLDEMQRKIDLTKQIGEALPESQTRFLDSEQWTKNITILNEVVEWMGYSKECHFTELLEFNTEGTGYHSGRTELKMDPNCKYLG